MKVNRIIYDWYFTPEVGEEYKEHEVGKHKVVSITENAARGEGDKWNYYVEFENGTTKRIFNINTVEFIKDDSIF